MRLLIVSHTSLLSGAEAVLLRVVQGAEARGWKVVGAIPPGALASRLSQTGVSVVSIPDLKLPAGPRPTAASLLAARNVVASRVIATAAGQADVMLVNGLLALPAVRIARPKAPVAWLVHDVLIRRSLLQLLRFSAGAVDVAIAVSQAAAAPLAANGIRRTEVVPNGTPWPVTPAPPADSRRFHPPLIGCAGLLTPWKGQEILLEATARLDHADACIELMGGTFPKDTGYLEELRRRAARPDLAGRVQLTGSLPDPVSRMRTWTLAVSPSVDPEAGPLVVLEAMSIGVPVVGTAHGGTVEALSDAGLLVPPRDVTALAAAIDRLLDDRDLYRRCSEAGPRSIASDHRLEVRVAQVLDHLTRLAAASSDSGA